MTKYNTLILLISLLLMSCQNATQTLVPKVLSEESLSPEKTFDPFQEPEETSCFTDVPENRPQATTFLLSVGSEVHGLQHANQDAQAFAKTVANYLKEVYPCVIHDVYKSQFEQALKRLNDLVRPQDRVIIYYSGHGMIFKYKSQKFYAFVTYDADEHWDEISPDATLLETDFRRLVNNLKTESVLTVIDACYSAQVIQGKRPLKACITRKRIPARTLSDKELEGLPLANKPNDTSGKLKGLALLAASKESVACESKQGGVFTLEFLKVLGEKEFFHADEIFEKAKKRVKDLVVDQEPTKEGNLKFSLSDRNNNE